MPDLIPLRDAAALLGVRPDTLRQQISAGRLHATKLARDWFVAPDAQHGVRAIHITPNGRAEINGKGSEQDDYALTMGWAIRHPRTGRLVCGGHEYA